MITKVNEYSIGVNSGMGNFSDTFQKAMLGIDETYLEVDDTNATLKSGSFFEVNEELYIVTSDEVLTISSGSLVFNSNTMTLSIDDSAYTIDYTKNGYYLNADTRVLRWNVHSRGVCAVNIERHYYIEYEHNPLHNGPEYREYRYPKQFNGDTLGEEQEIEHLHWGKVFMGGFGNVSVYTKSPTDSSLVQTLGKISRKYASAQKTDNPVFFGDYKYIELDDDRTALWLIKIADEGKNERS